MNQAVRLKLFQWKENYEIESKISGIQFKETAHQAHIDVIVYGQYRGYVEYRQDQRFVFYKNGITNSAEARTKEFDTQDKLEVAQTGQKRFMLVSA